MLPTFVIGLREGLEAALIVGIIAAFLRKQGRSDLLRQMAMGVAAAVTICALGGLALEVFSRNLPQRQQEGLETVIGILAVGMVTYMVIWMKEHARGLRGELESMAADALGGSGRAGSAMVVMAGLAVLREGFETVVFLLAAFNESGSGAGAGIGAVSGIALSVVLGYGIYRGGVRINLSKFFRATGLVLVLVAGGLVVTALHTAHGAGWLDAGQYRLLDLSWLVRPGSVLASLLTGMLGIQPFPVLAEVLGWLLYVIPVGLFVAWPPGRAVPRRALRLGLATGAALGLGLAAVVATTLPSASSIALTTSAASVVTRHGNDLVLRTATRAPLEGTVGETRTFDLAHVGSSELRGLTVETYATTFTATGTGPDRVGAVDLARLNGGRLPLGVPSTQDVLPARYRDTVDLRVSVDPRTNTVLGLTWKQSRYVVVTGSSGQQISTANPLTSATYALPRAAARAALAHARQVASVDDEREHGWALGWLVGILGVTCAAALALSFVRRRTPEAPTADPARTLVNS